MHNDPFRLVEIEIENISDCSILECQALEKLLFDRTIVGLEFAELCEACSRAFLQAKKSEIAECSEIAELVLLSKGYYYFIHNAYRYVFRNNLEINFVATSREKVSGDTVTVTVPYANLDAPARTLIIGDTIASGSTIISALTTYLDRYPLDKVFVFSIVGSRRGVEAIGKFCRENGIQVSVVLGLAAFGLGQNGFDLSFGHNETITDPKYKQRAYEVFGGKAISVAGWDFGSQAQSVRKYKMLSQIEAQVWDSNGEGIFMDEPVDIDERLIRKEAPAFSLKFKL